MPFPTTTAWLFPSNSGLPGGAAACFRSTTPTDTRWTKFRTGGCHYFTTGGSIFPQDANNLRGSYGAAEYDARHSVTGNFVWEVPFKEALRGHGPDSLVKGWQISGTILARTGNPYTVYRPCQGCQ